MRVKRYSTHEFGQARRSTSWRRCFVKFLTGHGLWWPSCRICKPSSATPHLTGTLGSLRLFLAPGGIAQLHRMALGLAAALFISLGYRLGIAFVHFGTAFAFGPAGGWASGWGRGGVGGWAGAWLVNYFDEGPAVCRLCFPSRRAKIYGQMWHGLVLGLQMRCLLAPGCGGQHLEVSPVLVQRLPEGT